MVFPFPQVGSIPTKDRARVHAEARVARAHPGAAFSVLSELYFRRTLFSKQIY
jgi:hypothetical protein